MLLKIAQNQNLKNVEVEDAIEEESEESGNEDIEISSTNSSVSERSDEDDFEDDSEDGENHQFNGEENRSYRGRIRRPPKMFTYDTIGNPSIR